MARNTRRIIVALAVLFVVWVLIWVFSWIFGSPGTQNQSTKQSAEATTSATPDASPAISEPKAGDIPKPAEKMVPPALPKGMTDAERKKLLEAAEKATTSPKPRAKARAEERTEKAADLRADIEETERRIETTKNDLDRCKEAARMACCRAVFLQAEKDKKLDEAALVKLRSYLQQKQAELKASSLQ